ncbi:hypothetical protein JSE7799_03154 [Jannaschia seosinensis]|uniref:Uncharacterized protein n=1 Tax=Jannaschia seosinensis TaxID=313367 RepID=A0A0M7BF60_9RHOB|nr:hypothetical protein JSE7799_03154 [Jannaschia seosinensis]
MTKLRLSPGNLFHILCEGDAKRGSGVQDGNAELELGNLTVDVLYHALPDFALLSNVPRGGRWGRQFNPDNSREGGGGCVTV